MPGCIGTSPLSRGLVLRLPLELLLELLLKLPLKLLLRLLLRLRSRGVDLPSSLSSEREDCLERGVPAGWASLSARMTTNCKRASSRRSAEVALACPGTP